MAALIQGLGTPRAPPFSCPLDEGEELLIGQASWPGVEQPAGQCPLRRQSSVPVPLPETGKVKGLR